MWTILVTLGLVLLTTAAISEVSAQILKLQKDLVVNEWFG
jgi:hypothetical protein